jgi:hypothetical protein
MGTTRITRTCFGGDCQPLVFVSDKDLFAACTTISLGNREIAKLWDDRWLQGDAPRHLAPDLFKIAFRKKLTFERALLNGIWMRGLQCLTTENQLDQFPMLRGGIQNVNLVETSDTISWKLTTNGQYLAASAYDVQFFGKIERQELAQALKIRGLKGKSNSSSGFSYRTNYRRPTVSGG